MKLSTRVITQIIEEHPEEMEEQFCEILRRDIKHLIESAGYTVEEVAALFIASNTEPIVLPFRFPWWTWRPRRKKHFLHASINADFFFGSGRP